MNQRCLKKKGSNRRFITKEEDGRTSRILVVSEPAIQFSTDEEEWLKELNMSHVRIQVEMPNNFKMYEVSISLKIHDQITLTLVVRGQDTLLKDRQR